MISCPVCLTDALKPYGKEHYVCQCYRLSVQTRNNWYLWRFGFDSITPAIYFLDHQLVWPNRPLVPESEVEAVISESIRLNQIEYLLRL